MEKKILNRMMLLAAATAVTFGFTACSDDDDAPAKPEIKITLAPNSDFETLVSEGTFELPVTISGIEGTPKASDFYVLTTSSSFGNMTLDWDDASGDVDIPWVKPGGLTVTGVAAGSGDNSYILTVAYDVKGVMDAEYSDCRIMYSTAASDNGFDFEYEGLAQESVGLPLATYSKAELNPSLSININDALTQLGITLDQFTDLKRSLYVGVRNGNDVELMRSSEFASKYKAFPASGYGAAEGTLTHAYVKISGAANLPVDQIFELHLIIRTEPGKYAAVNAPFKLTE